MLVVYGASSNRSGVAMKLATGVPRTTTSALMASVHPLSGWTMVSDTGRMALVWGPAVTVLGSVGGRVGSNPTSVSFPTVQVHDPKAVPRSIGTPVEALPKAKASPRHRVSGRSISAVTMAGISKLTSSWSVHPPMAVRTVAVAMYPVPRGLG